MLVQSHFVTLQIRNIAGFQLTKEVAYFYGSRQRFLCAHLHDAAH